MAKTSNLVLERLTHDERSERWTAEGSATYQGMPVRWSAEKHPHEDRWRVKLSSPVEVDGPLADALWEVGGEPARPLSLCVEELLADALAGER